MIAFGCSIISPEKYEQHAQPGVELARERDSEVLALQAAGTIFRSYNLLLKEAARFDGLEALVLVHEDTEIRDRRLCAQVRRVLDDPTVAVVGCAGAVAPRSIAWWDAERTVGSVVHRFPEARGGELSLLGNPSDVPDSAPARDVDTVDGFLMVLSPWAVQNLRFDESLGPHWGYDLDFCLQARAADRRVVVADLAAVHHHPLTLVANAEPWIAAHMRAAQKWDRHSCDRDEAEWERRARRAEAEAVVARLQAASLLLQTDALTARHARRVGELTDTPGWRMTAPLRRLGALARNERMRRLMPRAARPA